jgi:hypothetical protein
MLMSSIERLSLPFERSVHATPASGVAGQVFSIKGLKKVLSVPVSTFWTLNIVAAFITMNPSQAVQWATESCHSPANSLLEYWPDLSNLSFTDTGSTGSCSRGHTRGQGSTSSYGSSRRSSFGCEYL